VGGACSTNPTAGQENPEVVLSQSIVRRQNLVVYSDRLNGLIAIAKERGGPRELRAQADERERRAKDQQDPDLVKRIVELRQIARELEREGVVSDNPATAPDEKLESLRPLEDRVRQAQARANQLERAIEGLKAKPPR
jgi:hypothetical protein